MSIAEKCSCGAAFKTDEPNAIKLVREWRRKHVCIEAEGSVAAITGGDAIVERVIGFQAGGLTIPATHVEPDWEEE